MDTTAAAAIKYLKTEIHQGGNPNTLGSYSTAIRKILGATHGDQWPHQDLAGLDIDYHIKNFEAESDLEPASISVYAARFRSAVNKFLRHVESNGPQSARVQMLEIPYPLRDNLVLTFKLPANLSREEAERLTSFFLSLAR
jgi:hypothetical protein